ncbi:hypothetical protein WJX84_007198 [Apatococcus fuscideae]|uniref:Glycosyltransferase 2-like domain-containing protein n=1 Tax=Apatococcus fuscideae TaxID=2026836 RepID=A0AAW1T7S1_9CHLO
MQPGYDALGFISCTGTNFLVRAKAFVEVGMSPQYTMTEDFALGMELKKKKWHCRYVQAYLAVGEAPDQIRNCFQQRSRWTKGHFQIMFNPKVCPLFQSELSWGMRLMYCSGVWSYVVAAISTPFLMLVPVITIWIGVFPVIINRWAALGLTIYAAATQALLYYVRTPRHIEALYFANVANSLLWWSYVKACWRSIISKITRKNITFKATAKGGSKLKNSPLRDIWLAIVMFILLTVSIAVAIWQLVDGALVFSPLLISVLWAAYAIVPPFLLLFYATIGPGYLLQFFCRLTMMVTFASGAAAVGLMWAIHESDVATAKEFSGGAYTSEQIGVLFRAIKKGFTGSTFEKTI